MRVGYCTTRWPQGLRGPGLPATVRPEGVNRPQRPPPEPSPRALPQLPVSAVLHLTLKGGYHEGKKKKGYSTLSLRLINYVKILFNAHVNSHVPGQTAAKWKYKGRFIKPMLTYFTATINDIASFSFFFLLLTLLQISSISPSLPLPPRRPHPCLHHIVVCVQRIYKVRVQMECWSAVTSSTTDNLELTREARMLGNPP